MAKGTWGGARPGAGRPRKERPDDVGVMHRKRPDLTQRFPVHVSMRMEEGVRSLQKASALAVVERALESAGGRFGLRLIRYGVEREHLHLLAETTDKDAFRRAMTGLNVRIAKGLNKLMGTQGQVIAERYHVRILKSDAEVQAALEACGSDARPDLVVAPKSSLLLNAL